MGEESKKNRRKGVVNDKLAPHVRGDIRGEIFLVLLEMKPFKTPKIKL